MSSKTKEEVGQVKLKDSNMALYGSAIHKKLREKSASTEIQWKGSGKKPGVEIWRVENRRAETSGEDKADFGVKKWPEERHGEFFDGDSFIVLSTKKDKSGKLRHDIFMWLGTKSSQDELGVCAYKTVELDDLHEGEPIQHRVVQGHEPKAFRELFANVVVLSGGVDGGFNKVTAPTYEPRLLWVHGKSKNIRVDELPATAMNMNHSDVFILDCGAKLIQWNGRSSGPFEKNKASQVLNQLYSERLGLAGITTVEKEVIDDEDSKEKCDHFWSSIKGGWGDVKDSAASGEARPKKRERALYRISDRSGKIEIKKEAEGEFLLSMLDPKDVFVVDAMTEVFCWVGGKASREERAYAVLAADTVMQEQGIDRWTPITRVDEGGRIPPAFKRAFAS